MFGIKKSKKAKRSKLLPVGDVTDIGSRSSEAGSRLPKDIQELVQSGFPIVDGPHYLDVLAQLHSILKPDWYLEIGTSTGHSLKLCQGNFVAVDPEFLFKNFEMNGRKRAFFLEETSDDFFASGFLAQSDIVPDLGFLDGMHRFEFLLRDFIAFEKASSPDGVAVLHDCLPFNAAMTARDWDVEATRFWTGDVWKTCVILREFRPDLTINVLDAYPTGLVVVTGLDPKSDILKDVYEDAVARYMELDIETYGPGTYFNSFQIETCANFVRALRDTVATTRPEKGA